MSETQCPSCGAPRHGNRFCGSCGLDLTAPARASTSSLPTLYVEPGTHAPGVMLAGRYRVVGRLATGSMGTVYLVEDAYTGERCALKELRAGVDGPEAQAESEAWFRREGQTLMALAHPAIPRIHDVFVEDGRHCLVMDLVEGRTLDEVLLMHGRPGLAEPEVLRWADAILDVLTYLHGLPEPVIFRDLKPANIMLTPDGQVRLIDFGVARSMVPQATGTAIGTPGYAAPEQYQGLAEPASDVYGLGATLHHLLTGRDPRKGRPFDFPPVRSIEPRVSPPVAAVVDAALALDPRARPQSAAALRQALRTWSMPVPLWPPQMAPQTWQGVPMAGFPPGAAPQASAYPWPPTHAPVHVPPAYGGTSGGLSPVQPPGPMMIPTGGFPAPRAGRVVAGGGALVGMIATFNPWYTVNIGDFGSNFSYSLNGWHGWGFLAGMAFMAGTILSAAPAQQSGNPGAVSPLADRGQVMVAGGGVGALAVLGFIMSEGSMLGAGQMLGGSGSLDGWAWLALLCAFVMIAGGLVMVRQGRQRP